MMYYNPERPTVEFWLADESADLTQPIVQVGSIDLTATLRELTTVGTGLISVSLSLPEGGSVEDAVAARGLLPEVNVSAGVVTR